MFKDACAAILSFGIAFRHQYLERAELGKQCLNEFQTSSNASAGVT